MTCLERALLFCAKVLRAWRYHRALRYTWRLAWAKAGSGDAFV